MGRYNFSAQKVHRQVTQLLQQKRISKPPAWFDTVGSMPPSQRLIRPPMQRPQKPGMKASRMFQPVKLQYQEDELRWEYFNDHPWELARPRVVLENDGRDHEKWDWSLPLDYSLNRPKSGQIDEFGRRGEEWDEIQKTQSMRPINGEAVVQRQLYLLEYANFTPSAAYDLARKELYRYRHAQEIEVRVAREEALSSGAFFGPGPLEVGKIMEDRAYQDFRKWAANEILLQKQQGSQNVIDNETEGNGSESEETSDADAQAVASSIPASRAGQTARGGVGIHP